jgi:hypothetical protein
MNLPQGASSAREPPRLQLRDAKKN